MYTTHSRRTAVGAALDTIVAGTAASARRSQKLLVALGLALGTILLTMSATVAHAAPGDAQDSRNPPSIRPDQTTMALPPVHASENPVVFEPSQTHKQITITCDTPDSPASLWMRITKNGVLLWETKPGVIFLGVDLGDTYTVQVKRVGTKEEWGPLLTITTTRLETAMPVAQLPTINPTLIPNRSDPN